MSWRTLSRLQTRVVQSSTPWRRLGFALLMGLALAVAACGTSTGGGGHPTPTAKPPSPTATPVPCTSWRIVASPGGTKYPMSVLNAVSALSPAAAWAVGANYGEGGTVGPVVSLIEQWDGTAWKVVSNPGPDFLHGVTALSPTDVWAVGQRFDYTDHLYKPLTMHWNGTAWSVVPSPSPTGALSSGLSNVVAITAQDVWAFGYQRTEPDPQFPAQVLVERWNGASWQIVSSPPLPSSAPSHSGGSLSATRIPGTSQLWAVGEWSPLTMGRGDPLIERWTGTAWQIVPSPALPAGALGGGWSGVVALSATNAWTVGSYAATHPQDSHPMIAHWDGTTWQNVVTDLNTEGALTSVAAGAADDVRATGWLVTGPGASNGISDVEQLPLIEQWNGTSWQIASVPALPSGFLTQGQGLNIATDGAGNYWAVGSYRNATGGYQTLTMHCP